MSIGFLAVLLSVGNAAAPAPETKGRSHELYVRSGALGVGHCTFPAVFSDDFIALNLWLKAIVSRAREEQAVGPAGGLAGSSSRLWVVSLKGFAFVESQRSAVPPKNPSGQYGFANYEGALRKYGHDMSFRVEGINVSYPIVAMLSEATDIGESREARRNILRKAKLKRSADPPKSPRQRLLNRPSDILPFRARHKVSIDWDTKRLTSDLLDIQIRVAGLVHVCYILASFDDGVGNNLEINQSSTQGHNENIRPRANPGPSDGQASPDRRPNDVAFLMSPPFDMSPTVFGSLINWHIMWHRQFGVDKYFVYILTGLPAYLEDPNIRKLVESDLLTLVLWQDTLVLDTLAADTPESLYFFRYAHQIMAMCGLPPKPSTSNSGRTLLTSMAKGTPIGTLRVPRYNTVLPPCIDAGIADLCAWLPYKSSSNREGKLPPKHYCPGLEMNKTVFPSEADLEVNHEKDAFSAASYALNQGLKSHPLGLMAYLTYTSGTESYKSLHQPEHSLRISIHVGEAVQGAYQLEADANCVRWLHLVNLQHLRQDPEAVNETVARLPEEWFWPLKTGDMERD